MITNETRRESYEEVLDNLGERKQKVLFELLNYKEGLTANELAFEMHKKGYFKTPERNRVHPRLNELFNDGLVRVEAKRKCNVTQRSCAVYIAVE
jgi:hypothetical protein